MSGLRQHLLDCQEAFGRNIYTDFMLKHGIDYTVGPNTYAGPRQEQHNCYGNASHLAFDNPELTYVEGKVHSIIPIDHAWCVDQDGVVIDPTLTALDHEGKPRACEYFGVPFRTEYVRRAIARNGVYGVLNDIVMADQTLPKLFELGLDAGQQWLLDQPRKIKRVKKRRAA